MSDNTINVQSEIDEGKFYQTLAFFKALGDENRLRIVSLLVDGERNVSDLAKSLNIKEPTVSHHLSKLHTSGIVNVSTAGNQRFYRLNYPNMQHKAKQIADLDAFRYDFEITQSDYSWLDNYDFDEFERKTLRDCTVDQRLTSIPKKQLKLLVVLRWLSLQFEANRFYTEREVNEVILPYHNDYAGLRRDLVDFGFLRRERGGSKYWLTPDDETPDFD